MTAGSAPMAGAAALLAALPPLAVSGPQSEAPRAARAVPAAIPAASVPAAALAPCPPDVPAAPGNCAILTAGALASVPVAAAVCTAAQSAPPAGAADIGSAATGAVGVATDAPIAPGRCEWQATWRLGKTPLLHQRSRGCWERTALPARAPGSTKLPLQAASDRIGVCVI